MMESKTIHTIPYLPQEIISNILSRLPVKFLLRLKSTSKLWCSLISSEYFINVHLKNSIKNPTSANHRILSVTKKSNYEVKHYSLNSLVFKKVIDAKRCDFPIDKSVSLLKLVGSCNGLACILINKEEIFLWNPATTEFRKLPNPDGSRFICQHGFGFDESTGDYKVYMVNWCYPEIGNIYSLKKDSWTRINNDMPGDYQLNSTGIFVSGNLHWAKARQGSNMRLHISSFDLKNEVYGIMEPPHILDLHFDHMGVFDGCLSILHLHRGNYLDVWVLKQYGIKDSWSKLMTILDRDWVPPFYTISSNEEVLFKHKWVIGIAAYNLKKRPFWDVNLSAFRKFYDSDIYVESLVSINCK